jgi:hypothetical protein
MSAPINPRAGAKLSAAGQGISGGERRSAVPPDDQPGPTEIFALFLSEKQKPCYAPFGQDQCQEAGRRRWICVAFLAPASAWFTARLRLTEDSARKRLFCPGSRGNPLKRLISDKGIQGNPSLFLGWIWLDIRPAWLDLGKFRRDLELCAGYYTISTDKVGAFPTAFQDYGA